MAAGKRGLQRGLNARSRTVVLFSDATILTETPPLRACWSRVGEPAQVAITGNRRKATLYGTLNIATGARLVDATDRWNGLTWREHLRMIRRCWRGWNIVLFVDRGTPHTAGASRELATELGIELRWLPTACPELNPVEDIWRWLKGTVLANQQLDDFRKTVSKAVQAIANLKPNDLLTKAGVLSQNFWLPT